MRAARLAELAPPRGAARADGDAVVARPGLRFFGQQRRAVARGDERPDGVVVVELDARPAVDAGRGEPFGGQAVEPRGSVVHDQRPLGQPLRRQPLGRLPGRRQEGQDGLAPQRRDVHAAHRRLRQRHHRQFQAPGGEPGHAFVGGEHLHVHVDAGVVAGQPLERRRQQVRDGARRGAHPNPAGLAGELAPDFLHRVVRVGQKPAGPRDETLAQRGRLRRPAPADEQLAAQARLQLGELDGDGGRRQVERAGGVGQGAEVGDGDQGAQVVEAEFTHAVNLTFLNSALHIFTWKHRCRFPTIALHGPQHLHRRRPRHHRP